MSIIAWAAGGAHTHTPHTHSMGGRTRESSAAQQTSLSLFSPWWNSMKHLEAFSGTRFDILSLSLSLSKPNPQRDRERDDFLLTTTVCTLTYVRFGYNGWKVLNVVCLYMCVCVPERERDGGQLQCFPREIKTDRENTDCKRKVCKTLNQSLQSVFLLSCQWAVEMPLQHKEISITTSIYHSSF